MKRVFKLRQEYIDLLNAEPEKRDTWIFALKGGGFKQGYGCLYNENVTFCCMGVGQYVLGSAKFSDLLDNGFPSSLSGKEVTFSGFSMSSFRTECYMGLATLNDRYCLTFKQIARLLEGKSVTVNM